MDTNPVIAEEIAVSHLYMYSSLPIRCCCFKGACAIQFVTALSLSGVFIREDISNNESVCYQGISLNFFLK